MKGSALQEPLVFTRVAQTALYVESSAVPANEGYAAYWLASLPSSPAGTITAKTAWDDPDYRGWFVFLFAAPSNAEALAAALGQPGVLPDPEFTSFAWVQWDDARGVIIGTSFLPVKQDAVTVAAADVTYSFGSYGFPVRMNSPVLAQRDGGGEPQGFVVSYPPLPGFPSPNGRNPTLPLYGSGRFCLIDPQALIADFGTSRETGYDAAFRFSAFYKNERLVNFRYPLIDTPAGGGTYHLLFYIQWDPLGGMPPARTQLLFRNAAYILTQTGIYPATSGDVMPTYFRSIYDEPIGLRALTAPETNNPGRLVFDVWSDNGTKTYYLTPAGDFELAPSPNVAAPTTARRKLLLGLSGIESIDYTQLVGGARGDRVTFTPYQPAYAPTFPLTRASARTPAPARASGGSASGLLDSTWTTSYFSLYKSPASSDIPYYQSQAGGAPLFHQVTAGSDVLGFFDNQTALLTDLAAAPPMPALPYRGVTPGPALDSSVYSDFEAQIVSPVRASIIAPSGVAAAARKRAMATGAVTTTTTPQGFLADIAGTEWQKVVVARNATEKGVVSELAFLDVGDALRDALQTNELFLVASEAAPLGTFKNSITIADWPFIIDAGQRDAYGGYTNVLLFKFGKGTVRERAADSTSWTGAATFNLDPYLVSTWLLAYFAETEQLARDNARYAPFLELIDNPAWNGVLALRVNIELQEFPAQIKGLLGGIDLSRFYGHHIGVNVNLVTTTGGLQMADRNSLFGLISYVAKNDAPPPPTAMTLDVRRQQAVAASVAAEGIYQFRVLTLQVVFLNSEIADFASKIILTITRWFGDQVELQGYEDDPILRNSIVLYGTYEKNDGISFYTFQGDGRFRFLAKSKVLNYVEIVQAQFQTIVEGGGTSDVATAEEVRSLFTLWGYLSFLVVPDLDTLSFGNDAGDLSGLTRGLYCSDIGVHMSFMLDSEAPSQQPEQTFVFDASRIGFDLTLSHARPESLFTKFPFRVTRVESSDGDRKPSDAGYLPITTPSLKTIPLQAEWYGLYFALNLGSMGALAENAGFNAGVVAAWSPSPNRASATLLMQIPGTGSGKTFLSIESVLRIGINRIELVEQEAGSGYYLLKFANIGLFFLGKKLPTTGTTNITLFGSDSGSSNSNLAWYGNYFVPPKVPAP
jgi:hypothetical protein